MTCGAPIGRPPLCLNPPCPKGFRPWLKVKVFGRPVFLSKVEPLNSAHPAPPEAKTDAQASPAVGGVDP